MSKAPLSNLSAMGSDIVAGGFEEAVQASQNGERENAPIADRSGTRLLSSPLEGAPSG
jgi:hypothetical protein